MTTPQIDRGAYALFWILGCQRTGACTCGEPEGHAGWPACMHADFDNAEAPKTSSS